MRASHTVPGRCAAAPGGRAPRLGPALLLALLLLPPAAGCSGGGDPGPRFIDVGTNHKDLGWAMGDSITHGRDSLFSYGYTPQPLNDAGPDEPGYRVRLQELLLEDGHPVRLVEDGEPATFSAAGVARVGRVVQGRPAFLVLLYGTNDAYLNLPVDRVESNLRAVAETCRRNKTIVVLCTLPPACEFNVTLPLIDTYNAMIRRLAGELDARWDGVLLADLNRAFRSRGGDEVCRLLNPLGVHPTREGYLLIAETVYGQLKEVTWW